MIITAYDVTYLVFFEHRLLDLNSVGFSFPNLDIFHCSRHLSVLKDV